MAINSAGAWNADEPASTADRMQRLNASSAGAVQRQKPEYDLLSNPQAHGKWNALACQVEPKRGVGADVPLAGM